MSATLLGRERENSPEWDALRSRGVGGSEIAAVVGLSPWESPFSLWHRKRGTLGKRDVNPGMAWGKRLEPVVAEVFAEQHPELSPVVGGTYASSERPWQLANPDLLLAGSCSCEDDLVHAEGCDPEPVALLEVKTAHQYDAHEWGADSTEEVPPYYRCQVLWYLDVLDLPLAHVAVLIGGSDYREYRIAYAPDEAAWLRDQGAAFWQSVTDGTAPGLDGSDATYQAVRELHPDIDGETVQLDPDLHDWFTASKHAAEQAKAEHQAAKATVLEAMGQAQYAEVDGVRVYRRQPGRGGSVSLYPVPPFRPENTQETAS